jgi:hypothetical protein
VIGKPSFVVPDQEPVFGQGEGSVGVIVEVCVGVEVSIGMMLLVAVAVYDGMIEGVIVEVVVYVGMTDGVPDGI